MPIQLTSISFEDRVVFNITTVVGVELAEIAVSRLLPNSALQTGARIKACAKVIVSVKTALPVIIRK